jgi:tetratricopeptide (TPR) repeat protein
MTRRVLPAAAIVIASLPIAGCTGSNGPAAGPAASREVRKAADETLPAVVLPDLSSLAESVRRQIRERHASLAQKLANRNTAPAELAAADGELGRLFMASKFADEAVSCYLHAEALAPADMRWPYLLGHAYLRKGDRERAAAAFARASTLRPTDVNALVWLGETYLDEGRPDAAQPIFQQALSLHPQSAAALFGVGRAALARRAYAEAAQSMERALAADGRASAVHYPLAMAYRALGDREKAEAHLRQRGDAFPDLPDPFMQQDDEVLDSAVACEHRGMQALRIADWATAAAAFRRGLELEPEDASLRYWLGATLYAAGDISGAEREFGAVVRRSPDYAKAHFSLGMIFDSSGRRPAAIEEFRAAVTNDPKLPEARLRLAEALRAMGEVQASLSEFEAAVRLDPGLVEAWIGGGRALTALGRNQRAYEWLVQARRIHPGRPELAEMQARVSPKRRCATQT